MNKITFSDDRLTELWNKRPQLNQEEWGELYQIVIHTLHPEMNATDPGRRTNAHYRFPRLTRLPDSIDNYVNEFFVQKIMHCTGTHDRQISANHLIGFFKNYLEDCFKTETRQKRGGSNEKVSLDEMADNPDQNSDVYLKDTRRFDFSEDNVEDILVQYGLTRTQLTQAAIDFYGTLETGEQQVISQFLCPDKENQTSLAALKERYPQTASYYHIQKIGIAHSARKLSKNYHKTLIGQWLTAVLKQPVQSEHKTVILIALQILCLVALNLLNE